MRIPASLSDRSVMCSWVRLRRVVNTSRHFHTFREFFYDFCRMLRIGAERFASQDDRGWEGS